MLILAAAFIYMILAGLFESLTLPFLVLASVPMSLVGVFLIFWLTGTTFDSSAHIGLILLFGIVVNNAILLVARYRIEARERLRRWLPRGQGGRERQGGGDRQGGRERQGGGDRQGDGDRQGGGDRRDTGNGVDEDALPRGPFGLRVLPRGERVGALKSSICHGTRVRLRSILLTSGTTIVGLAPLLIRFEQLEGRDIWENLALSSIGGLTASVILILLSLPAAYYVAVRLAWFLYERVLRKGADT
jgi:multidrug efflux pump subunit AcrB